MKQPAAIIMYEQNDTFLDENLLVSGPTQKAMIVYIPANTPKKYPTVSLLKSIYCRWSVRNGSINTENIRANTTVIRQNSALLIFKIMQ
jgi:hypothetical protein